MVYRPRNRVYVPAPATATVVQLQDVKDHLRVTHNDEDYLIQQFIGAAVAIVERRTQRLLSQRQVVLRLPGLPTGFCPIELPGGVVANVTSVLVGAVAVTGALAYGDSPAQLVPAAEWPASDADGYPVVITYQAGFVAAPADLAIAVRMIAADLYERRSSAEIGQLSPVPISAEYLMAPHIIRAL